MPVSRRARSSSAVLASVALAAVAVAACGKPWPWPPPPPPTTTTSSSIPSSSTIPETTTSSTVGTTASTNDPNLTTTTIPTATTGSTLPGATFCGQIRRYSGWPTTTVGNYPNNPTVSCLFDAFERGSGAHLEVVDYNGFNALHYRIFDVVGVRQVRYTTRTSAPGTTDVVQLCTGLRRDFNQIYVDGCTPA